MTTESANPIPFSLLMGTALLANCYWLLANSEMNRFFRLLLFFSPAILIYLFVAANQRAPIISFLVTLVFLVCGLSVQRGKAKTVLKVALVVSALFAVCWFVWNAAPQIFDRLGQRMEGLTADTADSLQERMMYYESAWQLFQHSTLFGVGTGGVTYYAGGFCHNIVLEVAAENGIIGLLPFGVFVGGIVYYYVRSALCKGNPLCVFFGSCCIYYLTWALASGSLFGMKHLYFVAGLLVFFANYTGDRVSVDTDD